MPTLCGRNKYSKRRTRRTSVADEKPLSFACLTRKSSISWLIGCLSNAAWSTAGSVQLNSLASSSRVRPAHVLRPVPGILGRAAASESEPQSPRQIGSAAAGVGVRHSMHQAVHTTGCARGSPAGKAARCTACPSHLERRGRLRAIPPPIRA
eukprot:scaffold87881_cov65-Phaeocystis_antarctica.AAC.2